MEKEIVVVQLDFMQGPIWLSDFETGEPITGINVIDNDEALRKINYEIAHLYDTYYEFDSNNSSCRFNKEKEKKNKIKMLGLLKKLNERLDELNDGSFKVLDRETERVKKL